MTSGGDDDGNTHNFRIRLYINASTTFPTISLLYYLHKSLAHRPSNCINPNNNNNSNNINMNCYYYYDVKGNRQTDRPSVTQTNGPITSECNYHLVV